MDDFFLEKTQILRTGINFFCEEVFKRWIKSAKLKKLKNSYPCGARKTIYGMFVIKKIQARLEFKDNKNFRYKSSRLIIFYKKVVFRSFAKSTRKFLE